LRARKERKRGWRRGGEGRRVCLIDVREDDAGEEFVVALLDDFAEQVGDDVRPNGNVKVVQRGPENLHGMAGRAREKEGREQGRSMRREVGERRREG
jgi:hypothetical protein